MKYNILVISFLILIVLSNPVIGDNNYIINNDTVYIDDSKVYLSATPHTLSSSGWVYFNLTSKIYTGNIDACWGFNTSASKPTKAEVYSSYWVNTTTNHEKIFYNSTHIVYTGNDLNYGNSYNTNYKYTITESIVNDNGTTYITSNVAFDSYTTDGTNYTIYWYTRHDNYYLWEDFSSSFNSVIHDYEGYNKWYYIKNVPITSNKEYTVRAWIDVPVSTEKQFGKYYFAIKPSHETIFQAVNNGHFYNLDPWWNAIWSNRKNITLIGPVTFSKTYIPFEDGHIYSNSYTRQNTYNYVHLENTSTNGLYRGYIEWNISTIPNDANITNITFKYSSLNRGGDGDAHILAMDYRPSTSSSQNVWNDSANGTIYANIDGFPVIGNNQEINLGNDAITDLESALVSNWFAIGLCLDDETLLDSNYSRIYSMESPSANPKPTLYVEYTSVSERGNYQLLLNVTYESEMQSDFDDLRFCNETHEIDAWLESKVDSSYALVWVEFPTTPPNTVEQTYYMYYGNAVASSVWDIGATFIFGDDFSGDLSKWAIADFSIVNEELKTNDIANAYAYPDFNLTASHVLEYDCKITSALNEHTVLGFGSNPPFDAAGEIFFRSDITNIYLYENSNIIFALNGWTKIKFNLNDKKIYANDVYKTTTAYSGTHLQFGMVRSDKHVGYYDNFRVRKYASNPPTYTFGSEEYYISPTTSIANETKLIMSEITTGLKGVNMSNYLVYAFILIGILLIILGIQIITNNIYRR